MSHCLFTQRILSQRRSQVPFMGYNGDRLGESASPIHRYKWCCKQPKWWCQIYLSGDMDGLVWNSLYRHKLLLPWENETSFHHWNMLSSGVGFSVKELRQTRVFQQNLWTNPLVSSAAWLPGKLPISSQMFTAINFHLYSMLPQDWHQREIRKMMSRPWAARRMQTRTDRKQLGKIVGCFHGESMYPLGICYMAMENAPFIVFFPLKMMISWSYVSLPESTGKSWFNRI